VADRTLDAAGRGLVFLCRQKSIGLFVAMISLLYRFTLYYHTFYDLSSVKPMNIKKKFQHGSNSQQHGSDLKQNTIIFQSKKHQKIIQKIFEIPLYVSLFWMTHGII
jgi:hypothetical protein